MHHDKADIKQAPNKITQFIRKVKNTSTGAPGAIGFAKTIGTVAGILAPVPSIGKIKGVQKIAKAFSNAPKQYLKRTTSIPNPITNSTKAYNKLQYPMGKKAFSSKPVNFKGPNPANKIGAGGNSYPK